MACADAVKAGVGIDPDRRAYHIFIESGLPADQINHIYGFVHDPDAEGPSAALDLPKIQEAVLRFYDNKKKKSFRLKMATSTTGTNPSPRGKSTEELDDWEEEVDLETFLAGESDWIHRDVLDSYTFGSYVDEECSADKSLYEAYLGYKEARDTLNQVRRTRGFWPVIEIPAPNGRSATLAVRTNDESFRGKGKDSKGTTQGQEQRKQEWKKWQKQGRQRVVARVTSKVRRSFETAPRVSNPTLIAR